MKKSCSRCFHNIATVGIICLNPWDCDGLETYEVREMATHIDKNGVMQEHPTGKRKVRIRTGEVKHCIDEEIIDAWKDYCEAEGIQIARTGTII